MNIIIVRYKNPEVEEKCIASVCKYTDLKKHTLTVFDNAPENINLGKLWNQLIEQSDEEIICLLNSDCEVEDGWTRIEETFHQMQQPDKIGAIGPVTDNCGTVQKGMPRGEEMKLANDISGFCYVFRKSVWKEVGGFPEDMPFYGQESIFNRKLQDRGYKLIVDRRVFVSHEKGSSFKKAEERGELVSDEAKWGAFHYYNFLDRLKILRSIVKPDFKIILIGGGRGNPFPLHRGLEQAFNEFFGDHGVILRNEHCLPLIIDLFKPDLVLCTNTKYKQETFDFLQYAKKQGVKTAMYFNDMRCPVTEAVGCSEEMKKDLTPYLDAVFLSNESHRHCWETIGKVKTYFMAQGSIQHPKPVRGTRHRLLHIGTILTSKYHELRYSILKDFTSAGIEVTHKNSSDRDKRIVIQNDSYGDYHASDYSLAISMEIEKYTSDRLYTIVGAGGCALAYKAMRLDDIFKNREHVLWFRTAQEAVKIMERTTEEEREEIKHRAFIHGQKHHTYKMRLLNILQNLYTDDKTFHGDLNNLYKIGKV